jgi:hypothetical protein
MPTIFLAAVSGFALLATGACGSSTAAAAPSATASPAPLSSAWTSTGFSTVPSVAPAQVAPGAYHPVPVVSTGSYLTLPSGTPKVTASIQAAARCTPTLGPATSIPVTATAGTGTITAHWTDLSDPSVLTYRLAAIPNFGAPTTWLTVAATHTCKTLTTVITGLAKNTHYQVWLDAVHTDTTYGISGVTRETMIGRSLVVTVL